MDISWKLTLLIMFCGAMAFTAGSLLAQLP